MQQCFALTKEWPWYKDLEVLISITINTSILHNLIKENFKYIKKIREQHNEPTCTYHLVSKLLAQSQSFLIYTSTHFTTLLLRLPQKL